jgi:transcriptional regulator with XRE-family HTH domain
MRLSDQVRAAVNAAGVSRYAICEAAKVDKGTMSRFMAGHVGLSLHTLDGLADVLGLQVVSRGPVKVRPPQRCGRKKKRERPCGECCQEPDGV